MKEKKVLRRYDKNPTYDKKINYKLIFLVFLIATVIVVRRTPETRINRFISSISHNTTNYTKMFKEIKNVIIDNTVGNKIFSMPLEGKITSPFEKRENPITKEIENHTGIDIDAPLNTDVKTAYEGKVIRAEENPFYGKFIMIEHKNKLVSLYGHLNEILVNVGDNIEMGDIIAKSGSSGKSTGPHLHFEIRKDGTCVNPEEYLL